MSHRKRGRIRADFEQADQAATERTRAFKSGGPVRGGGKTWNPETDPVTPRAELERRAREAGGA